MSVYDIITERIIQHLEAGTVPWRRPWRSGPGSAPRNLVSGKPYRGVNVFLLLASGYSSPCWVTYRQARDRGGVVRKGEKGTPVIFWKWLDRNAASREEEADEQVNGGRGRVPVLRY